MEDKLEVGENLTPSIINSKMGRGSEEKGMPDIDFKSDLGPVARKMIHYWGFEPEISRVLGRDAHEYMSFNY